MSYACDILCQHGMSMADSVQDFNKLKNKKIRRLGLCIALIDGSREWWASVSESVGVVTVESTEDYHVVGSWQS
jgi:hypothetical protein